jgi:glycosyltransferase involved in cell wall biosynthesis
LEITNNTGKRKEMKRVAVFVKNLSSGGAEKQSVLLAKVLTTDCEVHYIIFNGSKTHDKYITLLNENPKVKVIAFKGGHWYRFSQFITYLKRNRIEFIFSYLTAANAYACLAGKICGIKVITGLRNARLPFFKHLADCMMTNFFSRLSIANCYSGKKHFISTGFREERIVVIPNCFEHIDPYSVKKENDIVNIIMVGRFVEQKDYRSAIESIALLSKSTRNIHFHIVGYGKLEMKIRQWVNEYQISNITTLHINPNNIGELLNNSDVYLSTSLFEGTSNAIMEALNANLPVVATNVGDNDCLVNENINGFLCEVKDTKTMAILLKKLVDDKDLRIKMGRCSKELLINKYGVDRFRSSYLKVIQS